MDLKKEELLLNHKKFAVITDIHFAVRDSSEFFIEKYRLFFGNIFFPKLKEQDIKLIICLGDTFEDRRKINVNGLQAAREMFFDIAFENDIKIITILGNHDVYYKNTNNINSIDILCDAYPNITLVDQGILNFGNFRLGLCSWINKENYNEKIEFINNVQCDYIGLHAELTGYEMTKGNFCEHGMSPSLFDRFDQTWSGHFHIKNTDGKIKYLGNPFQTNKGDYGYDRGFHIFDTDTRELEFIKNTYTVYDHINYIEDSDYNFNNYKNKIVFVNISSFLKVDQVKLNTFIDTLNDYSHSSEIIERENVLATYTAEELKDEYKTTIETITEYITGSFEVDDSSYMNLYMNDLYNEALNVREEE